MKKVILLLLLIAFFISCKKNNSISSSSGSPSGNRLYSITSSFSMPYDTSQVKKTITLSYIGNNAVRVNIPDYIMDGNIILNYSGNNCTKITFYDSTNTRVIGYHEISYNSNNQMDTFKSYGYFDMSERYLGLTGEYTFEYNGSSLSRIISDIKLPDGTSTYYDLEKDTATNDIIGARCYYIHNSDTNSSLTHVFACNTTLNNNNSFFPVIWLIENSLPLLNYFRDDNDMTSAVLFLNPHQVVSDSVFVFGSTTGLNFNFQYTNDKNGNVVQRIEQLPGLRDTIQYSYK